MKPYLLHLTRWHEIAAERESISYGVLCNTYLGSGDALKAVSAALLTAGGIHAPITQTQKLLQWSLSMLNRSGAAKAEREIRLKFNEIIQTGFLIPGVGSSFVATDTTQAELFHKTLIEGGDQWAADLMGMWATAARMATVSARDNHGKPLIPNLAFATAIHAIIEKIHPDVAPALFAQFRIKAWVGILSTMQTRRGKRPIYLYQP